MRSLVLLAAALCLVAPAAWATGADQMVYGSEELADNFGENPFGAIPTDNEEDLFGDKYGNDAGEDDPNPTDDPTDEDDGDLPPGDNAPVPEPATGLLLGAGALVLARMIRRREPRSGDADED